MKAACVLALCLIGLINQAVWGAQAKRELHFPDTSIGALYLVPSDAPCGEAALGRSIAEGNAQSTRFVAVPSNGRLMLQVNRNFLELLKTHKPINLDGIDTLKINISQGEVGGGDCDQVLCLVTHLKGIEKLRYLDLDQSDASDKGLSDVAVMRGLETISMTESNIKGACFKEFSKLPKLRSLNFERASAPDKNYELLAKIPNLESLSVRWSTIGTHQFEIFTHCKKMRYLNLSKNGKIDNDSLKNLAKMPQLLQLSVEETSVSDAGLAYLSNCPQLEDLNLRGTQVSDKGMKHLLCLKKLRIIGLEKTKVTPTGLSSLKSLPLKKISVPNASMSRNQFALLHKQFPQAKLAVPFVEEKESDLNAIFSPSH